MLSCSPLELSHKTFLAQSETEPFCEIICHHALSGSSLINIANQSKSKQIKHFLVACAHSVGDLISSAETCILYAAKLIMLL